MKQKLVVIGNGMAGVRCVEEILKCSKDLFEITIIGSEPHLNYNRILLSSVLQGEASFRDIMINGQDWYEENQITVYVGESAVKVDSEQKQVMTDQNRIVAYDKLIFATGSAPFILPIQGVEKNGVITFRTIEDCRDILDNSESYKRAAVIGGGVLGLEAARGLKNLGIDVTVIHNTEYLMQRQLDSVSSKMLQEKLEEQGIKVLVNTVTKEIAGEGRVEKLIFTDGTSIDADLVVMAVGVIPNVGLARVSGIEVNRGIVVDDYMKTSLPDVYAVGECVEHNGMVYGLVKPLYEQGKVLAKHICGINDSGYKGSVLSTSLKVPGIDLFSVGEFGEDETTKTMTILNEQDGTYKKIVIRGDIIVGAVLFGNTSEQSKLLDLILKRKHVSDEEKRMLLQSAGNDSSLVKAMKMSEIICNCNGVAKGTIVEAVQQKDLNSVEEVKQCTKASGSCGGCKPLVADLLAYIHSGECKEIILPSSLCSCTTLTEDEVVVQIQQKQITCIEEVFEVLGWKTAHGCSTCIPAVQYYLAMIYPDKDELIESLYVNERKNVQLEEDGTYSVMPQLYGGAVTSTELRKLALVMEKYNVTNVGLTVNQGIQLKGIKKDNLHAVCSDLGMDLSPVYTNTIRHVNTCFGEWSCSCSQSNALALSVELEKETEYLLTPHRIILGVSACKHRETEILTKDISVIGVNQRWEIYLGGSQAPKPQHGELLTVAGTSQEAKQLLSGLIQYYRETANYLESIGEWAARVGLIHIREVLFEDHLREQLRERLEEELLPIAGKS